MSNPGRGKRRARAAGQGAGRGGRAQRPWTGEEAVHRVGHQERPLQRYGSRPATVRVKCDLRVTAVVDPFLLIQPTSSNPNWEIFDKADGLLPKQAKDVELDVIQAFDEVVNLTLNQHTGAVNPFQSPGPS
jgi:hypothetical protein